jgi:hypothetical protein
MHAVRRAMPPAVPHRIIRPRRASRSERAQRRLARGTGTEPVSSPASVTSLPETAAPQAGPAPVPRLSLVGVWGIVGVAALLVQAIVRLTPLAIEPFQAGMLGAFHLVLLAAWVLFSAYTEGYKAFQKQFTPRVVARAQYLSAHPRLLHVILAPAFCMGFFHATRKRLIVSWVVTLSIVGLVIAVKMLAQPWRGIIDAGVVLALVWGVIALAYFTARALAGHRMPVPPDVP